MTYFEFTAGHVNVLPGDILKIDMTYFVDTPEPECEVYHVEKACCVLGMAERGPVIKTRQGSRLSTFKELAPDGSEVQPRPTPTPGHPHNGFC